MAKVNLKPMPEKYRSIPKRLRPRHPPVYTLAEGETELSPEDRELARELFKLLDAESQEWYGRGGLFSGL